MGMKEGSALTQLKRTRRLEAARKRASEDLFYLTTEILGYDLFSIEWHGPICSWLDKRLWERKVALFAPRKSYKSTLQIAEIIREILINPSITMLLVHQKLGYAQELVDECGYHIQHNTKLRELMDINNRPKQGYSNWIKRTDGGSFIIPGRKRSRHPTLRGASCGQDLTGQHPDIIFMDDIISAKTVDEMGGVQGIRRWIEHTVTPLVGTTGKLRIRGTMWSSDDYYTDVQHKSSGWDWRLHAILETDGKPDWAGEPIKIYVKDNQHGVRRWLSHDDVNELRRDAKANFPGQYMNDPRPRGSRAWHVDEDDITVKFDDIKKYLSKVVVLMDPAPLGMDSRGKMQNIHGDKDYWAIAVVGYLRSKKKMVRVLLDGTASQAWALDQGLNEARRLMRKWNAKIVGIEEPLGAGAIGFYGRSLRQKFTKAQQIMTGRIRTVQFKSTQRGKDPRIMDLCAMAGSKDSKMDPDPLFLINTDHRMNPEFLDMFFDQIRNYAGKGSLRHDDVIDAVAYCDDPALMEVVRISEVKQEWIYDEGPNIAAAAPNRSRYCPG